MKDHYTGPIQDKEYQRFISGKRSENPNNQLAFLDSICPIYVNAMVNLSPQQAKIITLACRHYNSPISLTDLAKECRISYKTLTSQISRLVKKRFLKKPRRGYVAISDQDLLRVNAMCWDNRFVKWKRKNSHSDLSDIVDRFIGEMSNP